MLVGFQTTLRSPASDPWTGSLHRTVAVRMEDGNERVRDYYLLPRMNAAAAQVLLREDNGVFLDAYRSDGLERLYRLTARTDVRRVG